MTSAVKQFFNKLLPRSKPDNASTQPKKESRQTTPKAGDRTPRMSRTQTDLLFQDDPFARGPMAYHALSTPNLLTSGLSAASTAIQTPAREFSPIHARPRPSAMYGEASWSKMHRSSSGSLIDMYMDTDVIAAGTQGVQSSSKLAAHQRLAVIMNQPIPEAAATSSVPLSAPMRQQNAGSGTSGTQEHRQSTMTFSPSRQSLSSDISYNDFEIHAASVARPAVGVFVPDLTDHPQEDHETESNASDGESIAMSESWPSYDTQHIVEAEHVVSDSAEVASVASDLSFGQDPHGNSLLHRVTSAATYFSESSFGHNPQGGALLHQDTSDSTYVSESSFGHEPR